MGCPGTSLEDYIDGNNDSDLVSSVGRTDLQLDFRWKSQEWERFLSATQQCSTMSYMMNMNMIGFGEII